MAWSEQAAFKYLIEVDGHGYQASLAAKLLLGSAVVTQRSHWRLWSQAEDHTQCPRTPTASSAYCPVPTDAAAPVCVSGSRTYYSRASTSSACAAT